MKCTVCYKDMTETQELVNVSNDNFKLLVHKDCFDKSNENIITLDSSISAVVPNGYLFCPNCGCYEHHPFRWCQHCSSGGNHPLVRMKEMSIRTFLTITSFHGSGPHNTLYYFLFHSLWCSNKKLFPEWKIKLDEEAQKIDSSEQDSKKALQLWKEGKLK